MALKNNNECLLKELTKNKIVKLKKGDELKIVTKKGKAFEGILFDFKEGYLQTISGLGILILFPISSLTNIYQI